MALLLQQSVLVEANGAMAWCTGCCHRLAPWVVLTGKSYVFMLAGAASIQTLQLVDSSTSSPVGMFVHSHHKPLLEGIKPLLTGAASSDY